MFVFARFLCFSFSLCLLVSVILMFYEIPFFGWWLATQYATLWDRGLRNPPTCDFLISVSFCSGSYGAKCSSQPIWDTLSADPPNFPDPTRAPTFCLFIIQTNQE